MAKKIKQSDKTDVITKVIKPKKPNLIEEFNKQYNCKVENVSDFETYVTSKILSDISREIGFEVVLVSDIVNIIKESQTIKITPEVREIVEREVIERVNDTNILSVDDIVELKNNYDKSVTLLSNIEIEKSESNKNYIILQSELNNIQFLNAELNQKYDDVMSQLNDTKVKLEKFGKIDKILVEKEIQLADLKTHIVNLEVKAKALYESYQKLQQENLTFKGSMSEDKKSLIVLTAQYEALKSKYDKIKLIVQ